MTIQRAVETATREREAFRADCRQTGGGATGRPVLQDADPDEGN